MWTLTECRVVCLISRKAVSAPEQHPGQGTKASDTWGLVAEAGEETCQARPPRRRPGSGREHRWGLPAPGPGTQQL